MKNKVLIIGLLLGLLVLVVVYTIGFIDLQTNYLPNHYEAGKYTGCGEQHYCQTWKGRVYCCEFSDVLNDYFRQMGLGLLLVIFIPVYLIFKYWFIALIILFIYVRHRNRRS
jgi:hypothetical protein